MFDYSKHPIIFTTAALAAPAPHAARVQPVDKQPLMSLLEIPTAVTEIQFEDMQETPREPASGTLLMAGTVPASPSSRKTRRATGKSYVRANSLKEAKVRCGGPAADRRRRHRLNNR